ncbi:MAG: polysaccharide biosynthesis tyrosine autokinase [Actinomycetota bacterium]|nr:polysaccharide biosynthesis tyrosine autokinase [Actinomycetota bacterium]
MAPTDQPEPGLRDYLRVLSRRKKIIAMCTVGAIGLALAWSLLQTPMYAGRTEVLLQPRSTESLFDPETGARNDPVRVQQTEMRIVRSQPIRAAVRDKLGNVPSVSVTPLGQTDLIEIAATNKDPERAAEIANTYATAYIDFRRKQAVDDVLAAADQIRARLADLQKQVEDLDQQVVAAPNAAKEGVRASIQPEKESLLGQQALFRQKLDQLQVDAALKSGGAQLVTRAAPESSPVSPKPLRNAAVAGVLGLMLGLALALLIDYLDDSVKTKDDLERVTAGVPVLGLIPAVSSWKPSDRPKVISLAEPKSPAAEAYRTLRTSIQFMALERPLRSMQVTSPGAEEGKTTTLSNLAIALAGAGHKVVIVCCDLRRPRVHEFFGLGNSTGFTSVLLGTVPLSAAIQEVPDVPGLSVLASGRVPPNPSELLSSARTAEVLTSLQAEADLVLVDSPPVLPVTDALILSNRVDATLLVTVAGTTTRKEVARTVELLKQVDAPVVGSVLNGVSAAGAYGYEYQYGSYEQVQKPQSNGKAPRRSEDGRKGPAQRQPAKKR